MDFSATTLVDCPVKRYVKGEVGQAVKLSSDHKYDFEVTLTPVNNPDYQNDQSSFINNIKTFTRVYHFYHYEVSIN